MSGTVDSVSFSVPLDTGAFLQAWEGWPTNGLYNKMIMLSEATYADIAAELRRRAEWHAGTVELTDNDSIAAALREHNPRWAAALRRMAGRLERGE